MNQKLLWLSKDNAGIASKRKREKAGKCEVWWLPNKTSNKVMVFYQ